MASVPAAAAATALTEVQRQQPPADAIQGNPLLDSALARDFQQRAFSDLRDIRPANTTLAYGPWAREFLKFCDIFFAHQPDRHVVTEDKAYIYLSYVAYRRKRDKRTRNNFDLKADFLETQQKFGNAVSTTGESMIEMMNQDRSYQFIGFGHWDKIRNAVRDLAIQQGHHTVNFLKSQRIQNLAKLVQARKNKVSRARCQELNTDAVHAYEAVAYVSAMEEKLWARSARVDSIKRIMVGLRNRFFFNYTIDGIVRGEAVQKSRLCDYVFLSVSVPEEPSPYEVLCQIVDDGKTNGGSDITYSKVIRHKYPGQCAVGSLAFYLLARFISTQEDELFDFNDNTSWFNAMTLVAEDTTIASNHIPAKMTTYGDTIRSVIGELGLSSAKKLHFGRFNGPALLEIKEIDPQLIRQLGNWTSDVYDKVYSQKMPFQALRTAAGFDKHQGVHLNARASFTTPYENDVFSQFFPHIETHLSGLNNRRSTASHHLELLSNFRRVVAQDAAALIAEGREHPLFHRHPGFSTPLFQQYVEDMKVHLEQMQHTQSTLQEKINSVLPQVGHQFHTLNQNFSQGLASVRNSIDCWGGTLEQAVKQNHLQIQGELDRRMADMARNLDEKNRLNNQSQRRWLRQLFSNMLHQVDCSFDAPTAELLTATPHRTTDGNRQGNAATATLPAFAGTNIPVSPPRMTFGDSPAPPPPPTQTTAVTTPWYTPNVGVPTATEAPATTTTVPSPAAVEMAEQVLVAQQTTTTNTATTYPKLRENYKVSLQVAEDWFGVEGSPFQQYGGLRTLHHKHRHLWRQAWVGSEQRKFNRVKVVANCIVAQACATAGKDRNDPLTELTWAQITDASERVMDYVHSKAPNVYSLSGMADKLNGFIGFLDGGSGSA